MGTMHRKEVCAALLIEMKNQRGTVHRLCHSSQLALKVFPLLSPLLSPVLSPTLSLSLQLLLLLVSSIHFRR